jgi:hypothetical protein
MFSVSLCARKMKNLFDGAKHDESRTYKCYSVESGKHFQAQNLDGVAFDFARHFHFKVV